jgi:hypothetical protein
LQLIRVLKDVMILMKARGDLDISLVPVLCDIVNSIFSYSDVNLDGLTLVLGQSFYSNLFMTWCVLCRQEEVSNQF